MSKLQTLVTRIATVEKHPNADRLDLVTMEGMGWVCITGKVEDKDGNIVSRYKPGDEIIYIEVDSVLDEKYINLFFYGSKLKPDSPIKHRLRSVRIRGLLSQGAIQGFDEELLFQYPQLRNVKVGDDVSEILNITKYEPPIHSMPNQMKAKPSQRKHPDFHEYTDIDHYKRCPGAIEEGEEIVATIKMHGTNFRASVLPSVPYRWFHKILRFMGLFPKHEKLYGSRRVQISRHFGYRGFYGYDLYGMVAKKYSIHDKLEPGMTLYGEIVGYGIQGDFTYGHKPGEKTLLAMDICKDGVYLDYDDFAKYCDEKGIPRVPEVYRGPFSHAVVEMLRNDHSHPINQGNPCSEGIVIKPTKERNNHYIGRTIQKCISDAYWELNNTTDFH